MKTLILFFFLGLPSVSLAEEVKIKVKGMVCAFCTTGVEKVFKGQEQVKDVKVDMDVKLVTVSLKEGKTLDDETITSLITDSGFNVAEIKRTK